MAHIINYNLKNKFKQILNMSIKVGVIGMGTMGSNLALNIGSKHDVIVYNRTMQKSIDTQRKAKTEEIELNVAYNLIELINEIKGADKGMIITMLPAGEVSGNCLMNIANMLVESKIEHIAIVDGANENHEISKERTETIENMGIPYLGVGISGGAKGAREGPCMMIGGNKETYENYESFFDSICASCIMIDGHGNGHLVKSIHNGIEYVMMQCIGEIYHLYSSIGMTREDIVYKLKFLRDSSVGGFLLDTTIHTLCQNKVDNIYPVAGFNETCKWTVEYAINNGIYAPTIAASLNSRLGSLARDDYICPAEEVEVNAVPRNIDKLVEETMEFVFSSAFCQGKSIISNIETETSVDDIYNSWTKGTIVACNGLGKTLNETMMREKVQSARQLCSFAIENGIPVPALSESITYFDTVNNSCNPGIQMIQSQRAAFGEHPVKYFNK
jgi:6-phosphogluconate dehydrogenase